MVATPFSESGFFLPGSIFALMHDLVEAAPLRLAGNNHQAGFTAMLR
jgi:hypothetical protein